LRYDPLASTPEPSATAAAAAEPAELETAEEASNDGDELLVDDSAELSDSVMPAPHESQPQHEQEPAASVPHGSDLPDRKWSQSYMHNSGKPTARPASAVSKQLRGVPITRPKEDRVRPVIVAAAAPLSLDVVGSTVRKQSQPQPSAARPPSATARKTQSSKSGAPRAGKQAQPDLPSLVVSAPPVRAPSAVRSAAQQAAKERAERRAEPWVAATAASFTSSAAPALQPHQQQQQQELLGVAGAGMVKVRSKADPSIWVYEHR
jgi:hypothetical protein